MKIRFFYAILFSLLSVATLAQIYPVSLESRILNSDAIVIASLKSKHAYWDQFQANIHTLNVMEIRAYLKKFNSNPEVAIITEGGILGNKAQVTCPTTTIIPDTDYILFLEAENFEIDDKRYRFDFPHTVQCRVVARIQGALPFQDGKYYDVFDETPKSEAELLEKMERVLGIQALKPDGSLYFARLNNEQTHENNQRLLVDITSIEDGNANPGPFYGGTIDTDKELIINGSGFESTRGSGKVEFSNADNAGATLITTVTASDYVSWSDTLIRVKIHVRAGNGLIKVTSSGGSSDTEPITIDWAVISFDHTFYLWGSLHRNRIELVEDNGNGGYTLEYSTNGGFAGNANAKAAFERALSTWRCDSGVNFNVDDSGTSTGYSDDGVNIVMFANLSGSTLGETTSRWTGFGSAECDMEDTFWHLKEFDTRFDNSGTSWFYGDGSCSSGQYDFETVALHELGHGHGLGHIIDATKVMHYSIGTCTDPSNIRRTLSLEESEAGAFIMAHSTSPNCISSPSPMTAVPMESCLLPVELVEFNGKPFENSVKLHWQTATETNNDFFTLERSPDGKNFETIAIVKGKGTTHQIQFYEYFDLSPALGVNYYRLSQTDFDGTSEVFDRIVAVSFIGEIKAELRPNPVEQDHVQLVYHSYEKGSLLVEIFSTTGQLVYAGAFDADRGLNYFSIPLSGLGKGIYIAKTSLGNLVLNNRFAKI